MTMPHVTRDENLKFPIGWRGRVAKLWRRLRVSCLCMPLATLTYGPALYRSSRRLGGSRWAAFWLVLFP